MSEMNAKRRIKAATRHLPQIPDAVLRSFAERGDEVLPPELAEQYTAAMTAVRQAGRAIHLAEMGAIDPRECE